MAETITLSQRFTFDAAHTLDREGSRQVHGHTYHAEVSIRGELGKKDMVIDLGVLQHMTNIMRDRLDHRLLDDVPELGLATIENLCLFIAKKFPLVLCRVRVWRADGGACEWSDGGR